MAMYTVKFYSRNQLIGMENFAKQEKAEESVYESPYASQGDFYEIVDNSNGKVIQEFMLVSPLYVHAEDALEDPFFEEEWFSWSGGDE